MQKFIKKAVVLIVMVIMALSMFTVQIASAAYTYNPSAEWQNSKEIYFSPGTTDTVDVYYIIDVPAGTAELRFDFWVGDGAPEIYTRYNAVPDIENTLYDGMDDEQDVDGLLSIVHSNPTAGTWYFAVLSTTDLDEGWGYARYPLLDGIEDPITNDVGDYFEFYIKGVTEYDNLTVETTGNGGNISLNVYELEYDDDCYVSGWSESGPDKICVIDPASHTADYYISIYVHEAVSDLTVEATITPGDAPSPAALANGVTVADTILSGGKEYFQASLSSGESMLEVTTSGGSGAGDADMYYKYPGYASKSIYDIASEEIGNAETITIANPTAPGDHNFTIYANGGDVEDLDIRARWLNGEIVKGGSKSVATSVNGEWVYYKIYIPYPVTPPVSNLTITTTGGTGDVSLYVEEGDYPTTSSSDKSENASSNEEEVVIASPNIGATYYIGVYSPTTFSGVTLSADYTVNDGDWVNDGINMGNYAAAVDIYQDPSNYTYMMATVKDDFGSLSATYIYKRDGRNWVKQSTLPPSRVVSVGNGVAFADNPFYGFGDPRNIVMYKRNGDFWDYAETVVVGRRLAAAQGNLVVSEKDIDTGTIHVYDCSGGTCLDYGTITDPGETGGESWGVPDINGVQVPTIFNPYGEYLYKDYGNAIATDGVRIIVSDHLFDHQGTIPERQNTGKVYVYKYSGGNWALEESFESSDTGVDGFSETQFGFSVDIQGSQAIVGAKYGEVGWVEGTRNGSAYIYEFDGSNWNEVMEIEHSDATNTGGSNGDGFGHAVAVQGNYAIISAPLHNGSPGHTNGRVYIFEKGGSSCMDTWCEIVNYSPDSGFGVGNKVAITGNSYYSIAGNLSLGGPEAIILNNNPSGSQGGGGGTAVPEFSDYILILTIVISIYFIFKLIPKMGNTPLGHA